jgi:hypothetical protein
MKGRWNWWLVTGFVTVLVAFASYFAVFVRFPTTRDVPWLSLLIFAAGFALLGVGLRRAYGQPDVYPGRMGGPVLLIFSVLILGLFLFYNFYFSRQIPASAAAPQVGQRAPDFTLPDTSGAPVTLSNLVAGQPWTLLVFYRGYW